MLDRAKTAPQRHLETAPSETYNQRRTTRERFPDHKAHELQPVGFT
jgi:hypothetical protein